MAGDIQCTRFRAAVAAVILVIAGFGTGFYVGNLFRGDSLTAVSDKALPNTGDPIVVKPSPVSAAGTIFRHDTPHPVTGLHPQPVAAAKGSIRSRVESPAAPEVYKEKTDFADAEKKSPVSGFQAAALSRERMENYRKLQAGRRKALQRQEARQHPGSKPHVSRLMELPTLGVERVKLQKQMRQTADPVRLAALRRQYSQVHQAMTRRTR